MCMKEGSAHFAYFLTVSPPKVTAIHRTALKVYREMWLQLTQRSHGECCTATHLSSLHFH